jgi:hypothetical protein
MIARAGHDEAASDPSFAAAAAAASKDADRLQK